MAASCLTIMRSLASSTSRFLASSTASSRGTSRREHPAPVVFQTAPRHLLDHKSPNTPVRLSCFLPPHSLLIGPAASQQHAANAERIHQHHQFQGTSARSLNSGSGRSAGSKPQRRRTLKRSRSGARSIRQYTPTEYSSDEEDDDVDDDRDVKVATEQSFSFYIGDLGELKRFFRRRFDELTTRPLRTIVTAWIKQLEPRRLGGYGKYHKQLPSEQPPGCTPPWWPEDVPYNEPSHLSKGRKSRLVFDGDA